MQFLKKLYVDLDAVVDLRLGVLNLVSPPFAFDQTTHPEYFQREEDAFSSTRINPATNEPFGGLPRPLFKSVLVQCRDKVLTASLRTKINKFVRQLCAAHLANVIRSGQEIRIIIEVNIHPFVMTPEAQIELTQTLQTDFFGLHFQVALIDISPQDLNLDVVRDNFFGLVRYEFFDWLNLHDTALRKKPIRDTCLYVPRLYAGGKPTDAESLSLLAEFKKRKMDPMEKISQALANFVPIQFLPIAFFCADVPANQSVWTDPT